MLKDGPLNRFFIRTAILAIRLITPFCFAYIILRLSARCLPRTPAPLRRVWFPLVLLDIYAAAEIVFYYAVYLPRKRKINKPATPWNPLPTREGRRDIHQKAWEATPDPRRYVSLWFHGVGVEELRREDVKDWMHWGLWNTSARQADDEDELEEYMENLERILKWRFPAGRGEHKMCMVTVEEVRMMHRPMLWYQLMVGFVDTQLFVRMWRMGFQHYTPSLWKAATASFPFRPLALMRRHNSPAEHLSYWYRPHKKTGQLPVLFIHGIGIGLQFYLDFLAQFKDETDVGLIALELLPISSRITHAPLSPSQMNTEVRRILQHHDWKRVVLMTHSYGSVVAAQIFRDPQTASLMGPLVFVDPVAFSFHPPDVAMNFLRREPTTASEIQLRFFASMDPGVARALTRSFVWVENSIWRETVEERRDADDTRCTVALAGRDIIIDTLTLGRYLTRSNKGSTKWYEEPQDQVNDDWKDASWTGDKAIEVIWSPHLNHAEAFDDKIDRDRLLRVIKSYCAGQKTSDGEQ